MTVEKSSLTTEAWNLTSQTEARLMQKLKSAGIPLGEYVDGKIFRGILTGLNEAFIITKEQRDELIRQDPKSGEIIKPFLTGKEIKAYRHHIPKKYLIIFPKGITRASVPQSKSPIKWLDENYPSVAKHLLKYETKAKARFDKGDYWWELRACDYYSEFEKPKIIFPDIALTPSFSFDDQNIYVEATVFILCSTDLALLALLNSKMIHYYFTKISSVIRGGYLRWKKQYLVTIPVNLNDKSIVDRMTKIAQEVLDLCSSEKQKFHYAESESLNGVIEYKKNQIDQLVYQLYGLTDEEIRIIEDATK